MRRYCGRDFSSGELAEIRRLIAGGPHLSRYKISQIVCQRLDWRKPGGGLKDMSCRVAMLRMERDGLLRLPPPRCHPGAPNLRCTPLTAPGPAVSRPVHELDGITLSIVSQKQQSRLWNEFIHRYHYLGYVRLPGDQLRYFAAMDGQALALWSFSAAAWQTAPRDRFIGWSHKQRQRRLHLIVNNSRFLILPWVRSPNLASWLLAAACRRLPNDWEQRYGYRPVLAETFVDQKRFFGTCYRAANWIHAGQTKGRGKLGPAGKISVPIKDLYLRSLHPNFRRLLLDDSD